MSGFTHIKMKKAERIEPFQKKKKKIGGTLLKMAGRNTNTELDSKKSGISSRKQNRKEINVKRVRFFNIVTFSLPSNRRIYCY